MTTRSARALRRFLPALALVCRGSIAAVLALGGGAAAGEARAQSCDVWTALFPATEPSPRVGTAMAYDSVRDRIVLFSGSTTGTLQTSTWEFNGTTWAVRTSTGPSPRAGHALVYDESRQRVVLFSGQSATQYENATWEWNGTTWAVRASTGPSPRAYHAMVWEKGRGKILLFGGYNASGEQGDTWEFDSAAGAWTQLSPVGPTPSPRAYHAMAWDSVRRKAVLFGGYNNSGNLADTWEWDPDTGNWSERTEPGPAAPSSVVMEYDPIAARCVLVAGRAGAQWEDEVWEWNGVSWTFDGTPSDHRAAAHMVYDAARERMVAFGGLGGDPNGIQFEVAATTKLGRSPWQLLTSGTPPALRYVAMAPDTTHSKVLVFGGLTSGNEFNGTTYRWDPGWSQASFTGPSPRYGAGLADDPAEAGALLFGGDTMLGGPTGYQNDTWRWDGAAWSQLAPASAPAPRGFVTMSYDAARGVVVLFGGQNGSQTFDDTWEWSGGEWTQRFPAHSPPGRALAGMAYDPQSGRTILFGGYTFPLVLYGDTWAWDGVDWTEITPAGSPSARYGPALMYDKARAHLVLYGGQTNAESSGEWYEWTGDAWRFLNLADPGPRILAGAATDPNTGAGLVFGGLNNNTFDFRSDTWATRPAGPALLRQPEDAPTPAGGEAVFSIDFAGSEPTTVQWRHDGAPLFDDAHVSGAATPTLVISPVGQADAGTYDAVVNGLCGVTTTIAASLTITGPACVADISGDGAVGSTDLALLLGAWGPMGGHGPADINDDGAVGSLDLALLLGAWGPCP